MRFLSFPDNARGFTLIEISIVVLIIGLIVAGFAQSFKIIVKQKKLENLDTSYDVALEGLHDFIYSDPDPLNGDEDEVEGRLPCPASPSAVAGSANFGVELCPSVGVGSCENDVCVVAGTVGRLVFIGTLPTTTMGISSDHMLDHQKNRLTYAVTANLTVAGSMISGNPNGGVVVDPVVSGTPINDAHFSLVSHGDDGAGSYNAAGVLNAAPCDAGTADGENCDGDAQFSERRRSLGETVDFYDDRVAFTLTGSGDSDSFFTRLEGTSNDIRNVNSNGRVFIGLNPDPTSVAASEKLVVSGDARIKDDISVDGSVSGADIRSAQHCDADGGNCFDPTAVATLLTADCGEGSAVRSINSDGSVVCEVAGGSSVELDFSCPSGEAITGIDADGRPVCAQPPITCSSRTFRSGASTCTDRTCNGTLISRTCTTTTPDTTCFTAGTMVSMADGTEKAIEDVEIGDVVLAHDGSHNNVIGFERPVLGSRSLVSINGGEHFVTFEHPIMTSDGWKSLDPEKTWELIPHLAEELEISMLRIGDKIIGKDGEVVVETISMVADDPETQLYDLQLDGTHTYFANGYVVHNCTR